MLAIQIARSARGMIQGDGVAGAVRLSLHSPLKKGRASLRNANFTEKNRYHKDRLKFLNRLLRRSGQLK